MERQAEVAPYGMSDFLVVIPVRYAATRLPGKPLLDIAGWPMIRHVWNAAQASTARAVVIAADDERVLDAARGFGAHAIATSFKHRSGMERLAEAVDLLGEPDDSLVVNVQGDEPLLPPALIDKVAALLQSRDDADMATLCCLDTDTSLEDPNRVKVVAGADGRALYFSRAGIPWGGDGKLVRRHIGIYAYRAGYLRRLCTLPAPLLEKTERLEQLRALYHGGRIVVEETSPPPPGVDTLEDLEAARRALSAACR